MLQGQLKLPMDKKQEQTCEPWPLHLASVYNFAIAKIEFNAKDKVYFSEQEFQNLLANHSEKLGTPSHRLSETCVQVAPKRNGVCRSACQYSTMGCSVCQALTGPTGPGDLGVGQWTSTQCGTAHPREVNAANNTLPAAAGCAVEVAYV